MSKGIKITFTGLRKGKVGADRIRYGVTAEASNIDELVSHVLGTPAVMPLKDGKRRLNVDMDNGDLLKALEVAHELSAYADCELKGAAATIWGTPQFADLHARLRKSREAYGHARAKAVLFKAARRWYGDFPEWPDADKREYVALKINAERLAKEMKHDRDETLKVARSLNRAAEEKFLGIQ